jgi:hypothetical protein
MTMTLIRADSWRFDPVGSLPAVGNLPIFQSLGSLI